MILNRYIPEYGRYIFFFLLLFLVFPPAYYFTPRQGLDSSYIIGIHLAHRYCMVFGKDIVFTFGPLAILHYRLPIAVNRWVFLLFDGYFLISLLLLLKAVIPRRSGYGPVLFALAGFLLAMGEALFQWYFLLFAFYLFRFIKDPVRLFPIVQAGLFSLLSFYYKVNLGIAALILYLAAIHLALFRRQISLLRYAFIVCSYLACLLIFDRILHVDLPGYITGSIQLIDAYSDAMTIPAGHYAIFLTGSVLIVFLVFSRWVYLLVLTLRRRAGRKGQIGRDDGDELIIYGIVAAILFVLYKSSFVRMDNYHLSHFFGIAGLVTAGLYVFSSPHSRKWAAICCLIVLGICVGMANSIPGLLHPYAGSNLLRHLAPGKISNYYHGIKDYKDSASVGQLPANEWERMVGDHTVDIIPAEISKIYFAGLHYDPRPVFQSYSAYNTYLDSINSRKYLSPSAPDFVLFSLNSIDNRYAFFDESRTKMAILSHYRIACEADSNMLLLQKKALTPLIEEKKEIVNGRLGESIPVGGGNDLQFSRISVHYSLWGKIKRFLYQPPALTITFVLGSGDSVTYPASPTILEDGVILNKYCSSLTDFQRLMAADCRNGTVIRQIRIREDPDNRGFEEKLKMVNTYYRFPARATNHI